VSDEITATLRTLLGRIAPEADVDSLDPAADVARTLELDSMDFLGFLTAIHKELGVAIAEADYGQVRTLAGCAAYVARRRGELP
jgi:acyl carrier protein